MKRNEAFPSKYLKKEDVETPVVWTIQEVFHAELENDEGKEQKPVVSFQEPESRPVVLNGTRWDVLEALYGEDSAMWSGKKIEIYKDPNVKFGGQKVGGVGFRAPKNGFSREQAIESLKDLRGKIVAAGGEKHSLKDTDIDTDDKLAVQLAAHKKQLEELLVKSL